MILGRAQNRKIDDPLAKGGMRRGAEPAGPVPGRG